MNILVIPSWYPSKRYPNNGSFFKEQTEAIRNAGVKTTVLCVEIPYRKTKKDFSYFKKNVYTENEITVYRYVFPVGILHRFPKLYYIFLKIISNYIYNKEFKKSKFDCIHAHSFFVGGYIAHCLHKYLQCNYIVTEHSSKILKKQLKSYECKVLKTCVNNSSHFICVSNNLKKHVEITTGIEKKVEVYPNMVSPIFCAQKKDYRPFTFVSIGNLIPLKKMDLLIEGFINAFNEEDTVTLRIIGDGIEKDKLLQIIQLNNREKQITLLGALPRTEVAEILSKSNCMPLVSETETFGIVYIEGLACGNVLIGAHNGGANDIIVQENGLIIEDFTKESVANALQYIYTNYKQYDVLQLAASCIEKYGETRFTQKYIDFYHN